MPGRGAGARTAAALGLLLGALVLALLAPPALAGTAYVANSADSTVTPIDTTTDTAGTPINVGDTPDAIAITPDGTTAYVTNSADDTVTPIDTTTDTAGTPINVGDTPDAIAITPDGATAYVADTNDDAVTPIDTATNTAGTPINVGAFPEAVAITPDGKTAYVANDGDDTITPIDTATNTAGTPIGVGGGPDAIAITPDGTTAYVADFSDGTVTPIDTATNTTGSAIDVGRAPTWVAITPDGTTAYVANSSDRTITPIDTATNLAGKPIDVGRSSMAIAITPDGASAYVANSAEDTVTPIDTTTDTPGARIHVGNSPEAIAIIPQQAPSAAFRWTAAPVGQRTSFDASGSTAPFGSIARYHWDFGDGSSAETGSPTISHAYRTPATSAVQLTVDDGSGCAGPVFTGQTASCTGSATASVSQPVTIGQATPTVTTRASTDVGLGAAVSDTATLAGGASPVGAISFELYGPDDPSCSGSPTFTSPPVAVSGDGGYRSAPFTPIAAGTYRWTALYSGDDDNAAVASGCNDAGESVRVAAPPPAPPRPPPPPPPPPAPRPSPSNAFRIGTLKLNKRTGAATLTVRVPGRGKLVLAGKRLRRQLKHPSRRGNVKLAVKPTASARRALRTRGRARLTAKITYTPAGGEPRIKKKAMTLLQKTQRRDRHHRHRRKPRR